MCPIGTDRESTGTDDLTSVDRGSLPMVIYKKDIKCAIFRHGVMKKTMKQMNPHAKKEVCERLFKNGLIYGCGKPFKLINETAIKCDYV